MDPQKMPYLKEEPYFGMGKMAVSWHHDENLVDRSAVAVYSYSCEGPEEESEDDPQLEGRDPDIWHVGFKISWDIETPGLAIPLHQGDCYFMLDDLNATHQHCVLAGLPPRFSSTHRVAECSTGTLEYISQRCQVALQNVRDEADNGEISLKSLESVVLKQGEEIHNEVEFEWLRQFWFQGSRHKKCTDWWYQPMSQLEEMWRKMEWLTSAVLREVRREGISMEQKNEMLTSILAAITTRQNLRREWHASPNHHHLPPGWIHFGQATKSSCYNRDLVTNSVYFPKLISFRILIWMQQIPPSKSDTVSDFIVLDESEFFITQGLSLLICKMELLLFTHNTGMEPK
ncbi:hypothetical protein G4228_002447 [Cervus hanglu yarkandensis]|nr:hypothetical protein G4228_002447 [Cervus hanglu yarkandensis]